MGKTKKTVSKVNSFLINAQKQFDKANEGKEYVVGDVSFQTHTHLSFAEYINATKEYCTMVFATDENGDKIHFPYLDEYAEKYVFTKYFTNVPLYEEDHAANWIIVQTVCDIVMSEEDFYKTYAEFYTLMGCCETMVDEIKAKNSITEKLAKILSTISETINGATDKIKAMPEEELLALVKNEQSNENTSKFQALEEELATNGRQSNNGEAEKLS